MSTRKTAPIAGHGARKRFDAALEFTKCVVQEPFAPGAVARRDKLAGFLRITDTCKVNQHVKGYLETRKKSRRGVTETVATPFIVALLLAHMELDNVVSTGFDRDFYIKWIADLGAPLSSPVVLVSTAFRLLRVRECIGRIRGTSTMAANHRQRVWQLSVGGAPYALPDLDAILRRISVHISGESGTGKELVAQAILAAVPVDQKSLDPRNAESISLAGIPESLMYMELFGAAKGAATGVLASKGLFERTDGGAAFIDEVAELSPVAQAAMLRTLETGFSKRLGAAKSIPARPRVVSATHADLQDMVRDNRFRMDLFYRLCGQTIRVPSLRERKEDIPAIIEGLVMRMGLGAEFREKIVERACDIVRGEPWSTYAWPGNVRELDGFVKSIAVGWPVQEPLVAGPSRLGGGGVPDEVARASWSRQDLECWYARRVMSIHKTKTAAADVLGVTRNTLNKMLGR